MSKQSYGDGNERQDEVDREGVLGAVATSQLHHVEEEDGESDDDRLPHLHTIDTGQDVDSISAEYSQHAHVHVIEHA